MQDDNEAQRRRGFNIIDHEHDLNVWGECSLDGCEFGAENAAENRAEYEADTPEPTVNPWTAPVCNARGRHPNGWVQRCFRPAGHCGNHSNLTSWTDDERVN